MSEQNYKIFWDEALRQIREEYKSQNKEDLFDLWFKMDYIEDNQNEITVSVSSEFMWNQMVMNGNVDMVSKKIEEITGKRISIVSKVSSKPKIIDTQPYDYTETSLSQTVSETTPYNEHKPLKKHPQLLEKYTFDTFIPGENSDFAYSACLAIAKDPGKTYNPVLIYGGVGLGKTHLMESIGNYIYQERGESSKICYVTAENLMNEFTSAIRSKTTQKFKDKYRNLDVFLVDDIQFLNDKEGFQEEFFHTFEALYNKKSQMAFTCDRPISEVKGIHERLRTRFSRGMSIDLQPPNYETRRAIIQKKLELLQKDISPEVVDFIAKNVQSNVRDLESCLTKVIGYSELLNKPVTIEIAQKLLRDTFSQVSNGAISIEIVQKVVAEHYNISLSDIKSKKRNHSVVLPRQIAIYLAREMGDYSFPDLGNEFGGRDHTTAMHSYNLIENALKDDPNLNSTIELLKREIKDYRK